MVKEKDKESIFTEKFDFIIIAVVDVIVVIVENKARPISTAEKDLQGAGMV